MSEDGRESVSAQLSKPCSLLDLCQLSSPDLGPVCHDREDAGTVSDPQTASCARRSNIVCSSSQALIRGHRRTLTHLRHKISVCFYFETPVSLLFLQFFCVPDHNSATATLICAFPCVSLCRWCVFLCHAAVTSYRNLMLLNLLSSLCVFSSLLCCFVSPDV